MNDFYFKVLGDPLDNFSIKNKSPIKLSFTEKSLDVAKVKAESECRKLGFNAFIEYTAETDMFDKVQLVGTPAKLLFLPGKQLLKDTASLGLNVSRSIGQKLRKWL